MGPQNHDHGCGLRKVVNQFVANTNLHPTSFDLRSPSGQKTKPPRRRNSTIRSRRRGGSIGPDRPSATGALKPVEIEVPAQKLGLTSTNAFHQHTLVRIPTLIKPIGGFVAAWNVEESPRPPLAYLSYRT
jgi:hypothetical protein